jgi:hypothetical protein
MAYFLDKVGDMKESGGKRTRNDFDEASAVPALQQVPNKRAPQNKMAFIRKSCIEI